LLHLHSNIWDHELCIFIPNFKYLQISLRPSSEIMRIIWQNTRRVFYYYLTDNSQPDALVSYYYSYHWNCLSSLLKSTIKPPRQAAYDAMLAKRRVKCWVGAYRSSRKKETCTLHNSYSWGTWDRTIFCFTVISPKLKRKTERHKNNN
jgi:hypothetical protein